MAIADKKPRLRPEMASLRLLVLAFVRDYLEEHHGSPSYGEIAAALDCSRDRVKKTVKQLVRAGDLLQVSGPRGLSLPTLREQAIRLLREHGYTVDPEAHSVHPPGAPITNPPLLPPARLTYPEDDGDRDAA